MNDLIVDGNSLFARCWYAVKGDEREAMKVSVGSVLQLLDQGHEGRIRQPISRTLFGWDGKSKTEKNRAPKPPGYIETRYRFQEALLTLFNTVHGFDPELEADDIVATAVFDSTAKQIIVVSGDKDLMQLHGDNVVYYDLNSKGFLPSRTICKKMLVKKPNQIPLALAVMGDSGDGIIGVPKWGKKRVEQIFEWITDKMTFEEAMKVVLRELPADLHDYFYAALDKTLLHTDAQGVPEPSELRFCSETEFRSLKIVGVAQAYEHVALQYEDGAAHRKRLTSMIKGSRSE